jgi:hypothetical protein
VNNLKITGMKRSSGDVRLFEKFIYILRSGNALPALKITPTGIQKFDGNSTPVRVTAMAMDRIEVLLLLLVQIVLAEWH